MYEIERKENEVIIRKQGHAVYTASLDSYIVYRNGTSQDVSQLKDLTNDKLLLALVNAIEIKE
ncbi:MAG: hypothetical protein NVSMB6_33120 [Burkholderiaceae bacterium]